MLKCLVGLLHIHRLCLCLPTAVGEVVRVVREDRDASRAETRFVRALFGSIRTRREHDGADVATERVEVGWIADVRGQLHGEVAE